jgi:hypothetical protein
MAARPKPKVAAPKSEVAGNSLRIDYEPDGAVLTRYLLSPASVPLIMGPRASAKSTASCIKLYGNSLGQWAGRDGWIRRRTCIVRATYDELKRTTIQTWRMWFPEAVWGPIIMGHPPTHRIRKAFGRGGLDWEVVFLALDSDEAAKKLTSSEYSDAFINEAWETGRDVVSALRASVGRYPNSMLAVGHCGKCGAEEKPPSRDCPACGAVESIEWCYRPQVIMDTNGPPMGHWISYMSGLEAIPPKVKAADRLGYEKPDDWEFFIQPPGLIEEKDADGVVTGYRENPDAENRKYRRKDYYISAAAGATPEFIQRYLIGRPGTAASGSGIMHQFRTALHVAKEPFELTPGWPVLIGMDFGRTPAIVVGQKVQDRWWRVVDELDGIETSAREFAEDHAIPFLSRLVSRVDPENKWDWEFVIHCDPAGDHHSEATDTTPIREVRATGLRVIQAFAGQKFTVRRDTLNALFCKVDDGRPVITLSPRCRSLIRAMAGGYCYPRITLPDGTVIMGERPDKRNPNTHVANALEYLITGHDKGAVVLTTSGQRNSAIGGISPRPASFFTRVAGERKTRVLEKPKGFMQRRRGQ